MPPSRNVQRAVPFLWVHDLDASLRFYVDGLGFEKTCEWAPAGKLQWCSLKLGDATIMLQEFWREGPHANVPADKLGVGCSVCFICQDALAIYQAIRKRGVEASEPFVGNAMWVTSVTDPDGYRLEFESPTDVPEETPYSQFVAQEES